MSSDLQQISHPCVVIDVLADVWVGEVVKIVVEVDIIVCVGLTW